MQMTFPARVWEQVGDSGQWASREPTSEDYERRRELLDALLPARSEQEDAA